MKRYARSSNPVRVEQGAWQGDDDGRCERAMTPAHRGPWFQRVVGKRPAKVDGPRGTGIISKAGVFCLIAGIAGPLTLTLVSTARAQEGVRAGSRTQIELRPWLALDRCAAYGPEFTTVEGTDACVKIGGHVRVEFGPQNLGRTIKQGWGRAAPAAMRSEGFVGGDPAAPQAQHLRLRDDGAPSPEGSYLR